MDLKSALKKRYIQKDYGLGRELGFREVHKHHIVLSVVLTGMQLNFP